MASPAQGPRIEDRRRAARRTGFRETRRMLRACRIHARNRARGPQWLRRRVLGSRLISFRTAPAYRPAVIHEVLLIFLEVSPKCDTSCHTVPNEVRGNVV